MPLTSFTPICCSDTAGRPTSAHEAKDSNAQRVVGHHNHLQRLNTRYYEHLDTFNTTVECVAQKRIHSNIEARSFWAGPALEQHLWNSFFRSTNEKKHSGRTRFWKGRTKENEMWAFKNQNQNSNVLEAATFLEASGWRACRITRGLLMHSVYELLPRHFSSDETDCWNCGRQRRVLVWVIVRWATQKTLGEKAFVSALGFHEECSSSNRFGRLSCERGSKQKERSDYDTNHQDHTSLSLTHTQHEPQSHPDNLLVYTQGGSKK